MNTPAAPDWTRAVPDNGYAWWYIDALSDCGRYGLTIIAFIGSVFSPYYAWRRRRGPTPAMQHCALNIALYGPGGRWAMTERGSSKVEPQTWRIGPSCIQRSPKGLRLELDEVCAPLPRRVRGQVQLEVHSGLDEALALDAEARHLWQPWGANARVRVTLQQPQLQWTGRAYADHNRGSEALEQGFRRWHWSRFHQGDGCRIVYAAHPRRSAAQSLDLHIGPQGLQQLHSRAPEQHLGRGFWGVERPILSEPTPQLLKAMEDAPFYTRSHVRCQLDGQVLEGVHESLDLDRFAHPLVQLMLPFRMPRRA
nr:carotenoid 1,2-hydratase [Oceanococcus sp. HetDA_MAG_MS8]